MNFARRTKGLAVCLAVVGFCIPQPLFAAVQTDKAAVTDVTLHKSPQGNVLIGQVQDQQGAAVANVLVVLHRGREKPTVGKTDGKGYFTFTNLKGGVYQVTLAEGEGMSAYRAWTPGTAPPSAQPGVLVVAGKDLVRGNRGHLRRGVGCAKFWLCHPCVIAGIVAVGVAVPIAIHNSGSHSP
ncbi:MAG: carboxypeptidase-like regulatory domain-containing protein [Planctomycetota bacterium]